MKKVFKRFLTFFIMLFICMNVIAAFHAYRFTHFDEDSITRTKSPKQLSLAEKLEVLVFGVKFPKPQNTDFSHASTTVYPPGKYTLETWHKVVDSTHATVLIFHGYGGCKSQMTDKAEYFNSLGLNTLLVDFACAGGSVGNQCTLGYYEAEQVKQCIDYIDSLSNKGMYLFGSSMGAVSIMRCMSIYSPNIEGIMLECPFGSMRQTVKNRFRNMNIPDIPMADLLMFWGGVENNFWAFGHNPIEYAKEISTPTILLFGEKDDKVNRSEIDKIYNNLSGDKTLILFPEAGHENYHNRNAKKWESSINKFLKKEIP